MQYTVIHCNFYGCKNDHFETKACDICFILLLNIDCGYLFELPQNFSGSNKYTQSMF